MGLHLNLEKILEDNKQKKGLRKMGFLINEGDKLTVEGRKKLQQQN